MLLSLFFTFFDSIVRFKSIAIMNEASFEHFVVICDYVVDCTISCTFILTMYNKNKNK